MGQTPSKPLTDEEFHRIQSASWANGAWDLNEAPDGIVEAGLGVDSSLAVTWEANFGDAPQQLHGRLHSSSSAYLNLCIAKEIRSQLPTLKSWMLTGLKAWPRRKDLLLL